MKNLRVRGLLPIPSGSPKIMESIMNFSVAPGVLLLNDDVSDLDARPSFKDEHLFNLGIDVDFTAISKPSTCGPESD